MPVLGSWKDFIPDGGQARDVVDEATKKATLVAGRLAHATDRECAEALLDVTAEAYRIIAIVGPGRDFTWRFREIFDRARTGLDRDPHPSRRAIAGVLAFSNLILSRGGYIDGHYDPTTRDGLKREIRWIELASRLPRGVDDRAAELELELDRIFGFAALAALAAGRRERALGLSSDEALARLAAAVDQPTADARRAFVAYVEAFPTAPHGYVELGFVARAYVVLVEKRGDGGIGAAVDWLRRCIHEGPPKIEDRGPAPTPAPPAPPLTIPDDLAARVAPLVASEDAHRSATKRLSFSALSFTDIHGLWGGRSIELRADGRIEARVAPCGGALYHYRARLSSAGIAEIEALVRRCPIRAIPPPTRNGVAGEGFPSLAIDDADGTCHIGKWANDPNPAFYALSQPLDDLARYISATTTAIPEETLRAERALTAGQAFLLAYLPSRRLVQEARRELFDRHAASDDDAAVKQAIAFLRAALDVEESMVAKSDARLTKLARRASIAITAPPVKPTVQADEPAWQALFGPVPLESELAEWLTAFTAAVGPHLTTPLHGAAFRAGEAARFVAICVALAASVAHIRSSAPESAALREQAADLARDLKEAAETLKARLEATGLPPMTSRATDLARLVSVVTELEPTTADGLRQLNELAHGLDRLVESTAPSFDRIPTDALEGSFDDFAFRETL